MVGYLITLAIFVSIYALFSLGLNLQWGFTGLINFGHIAFMTIGAYTTILISSNGLPRLLNWLQMLVGSQDALLLKIVVLKQILQAILYLAIGAVQFMVWLTEFIVQYLGAGGLLLFSALVGSALAAFLGFLIGLSTLRLREDYLAIVTIGVSEVVRLIALNEEEVTGGTRGVYGYPLPLAQLDPNIPVKLAMSGVLTAIFGIGLWKLWRWIAQLPQKNFHENAQDESRGKPIRSQRKNALLFTGYLGCLVLLGVSLWLSFSLNLGFLALGIVPLFLGIIVPSLRFEQPLRNLKHQNWNTRLTLGLLTLTLSFVLMIYWSGITQLWAYTYKGGLLWLLVATVALVFWRLEALVNSPWGRVLKAIREDEEVAKALGKNVFRYKLQSLMIGGAIAGLAGSFYAWQLTFINPDGFIPLITFQAWIIVVLGGSGNNVGTLLGAMIFWAYDAITRLVLPSVLPFDDARLGAFRVMVIGLLMIVIMMWRPQGILGNKDELTLNR
jgi:neutral amino acid transport system permease protein